MDTDLNNFGRWLFKETKRYKIS